MDPGAYATRDASRKILNSERDPADKYPMKIDLQRYRRLVVQGLTDRRWLHYYIQRQTLNLKTRRHIGSLVAKLLPKTPNLKLTPEASRILGALKDDGLFILNNYLDEKTLRDIRSYLDTKKMYDPYRPDMPHFSDPKDAHKTAITGYYQPEDTLRTPHLIDLANDPRIITAIEGLFGCKPTISYTAIWWSFAGLDKKANAEILGSPDVYHRDLDDWAQIKLFVYLTDVTQSTGPHAFIAGSHRECQYVGRKDGEVKKTDPDGAKLVLLAAPAGTGILERSIVLHRGTIPETAPRLILSFTYSLFPLPYMPKNLGTAPVDMKSYDPYINRIFFRDAKVTQLKDHRRKKAA